MLSTSSSVVFFEEKCIFVLSQNSHRFTVSTADDVWCRLLLHSTQQEEKIAPSWHLSVAVTSMSASPQHYECSSRINIIWLCVVLQSDLLPCTDYCRGFTSLKLMSDSDVAQSNLSCSLTWKKFRLEINCRLICNMRSFHIKSMVISWCLIMNYVNVALRLC